MGKPLKKLENFTIEECIFEDKIDYEKIKLKESKNLKYVSFYKNGITNTKFLELFNNNKSFPKLKTLYFGGNLINAEEIKKNKRKFCISSWKYHKRNWVNWKF